MFAADVDGDGDLDALSASFSDDSIAWFAADMDGDGDLEIVSASWWDDAIAWYPNQGGQFALPTTALAQGVLAGSQEDAALQIDLEHRGRAGDSDVALDSVELRLEDGGGNPLNNTQANALIEKLELILVDGTGSFEFPGDTLVGFVGFFSLTGGVQSIVPTPGDPAFEVAFGDSKRYFVVVTMTTDASSQTPDAFELFHLTESSSGAHDASTPAAPFTPLVPLQLEFQPDTTTGLIDTVLSSASCKAPFELDLEGFLVTTPVVCEAGTTLSVDGVTVSPTGDLILRAGQRVRFVTDFSVQPAGKLAAEIDPLLEP